MKFSKFSASPAKGVRRWGSLSQLLLVSAVALAVSSLLTACQLVTIDFVFLASSSPSAGGQIQTFAVDSQSGALRNGPPAVDAGGTSPVAMATTADYANLYVANSDNNTVVHFAIATNGVLTQKDKVTLAGPPASVAVNQAGTYLYVVSGDTTATLSEYALSSGAIGNLVAQVALTIPGNTGDQVVPTGVTTLVNNGAVYAIVYDKSSYNPGGVTTSTAHPGWLFGFGIGSGGVLTPAAASPYQAGVKPSGIVADQTNRFVYVTDYASNQLIGYTIYSGDVLNYMISGPYRTGAQPTAIAIDPRAKYLYVSNGLDSSVTAYAIDLATGIPSQAINSTGSQINSTDTQPVSIAVDPALGRFVFTANYLGNSASGFFLNPNTGQLTPSEQTPYPTFQHPTALVSVPHGNHAIQVVTP
ncbi:MAG: lactonase family protein [Acidobacteriota bacterium]